jgi:hypothetical protein
VHVAGCIKSETAHKIARVEQINADFNIIEIINILKSALFLCQKKSQKKDLIVVSG